MKTISKQYILEYVKETVCSYNSDSYYKVYMLNFSLNGYDLYFRGFDLFGSFMFVASTSVGRFGKKEWTLDGEPFRLIGPVYTDIEYDNLIMHKFYMQDVLDALSSMNAIGLT